MLTDLPVAEATTKPGVQATPYNNGPHPWSDNGCTAVPDSGLNFNFNHACIHHDGCYRNHWSSRATCDKWFLNDMYASCNAMFPSYSTRRPKCYVVAVAYYGGVRALGANAYTKRSASIPMNAYA